MRSEYFMLYRVEKLGRPVRKIAQGLAIFGLFAASAALTVGNATAAPNAAIVVDAKSGKVLYSSNADAKRHPASLTKMMTLYMLFEKIDSGSASLNSNISVSSHCAGQAPSKLGFKPGQTIKARDAVLALVTKSANDVACAVGEFVSGTESGFGRKMTARARTLGMSNTTFRNASGLPDSAQVTTARDMATLGRALQDHFPKYYDYFSTTSFKWKGRTYGNHNRLLGNVKGVDGIKTGYTRASGFNLVTSVKRGNRDIVAVVLGGDTGKARDQRMASLIEKYIPRATNGNRTVAMVQGAPDGTTMAFAIVPIPPKRPEDTDPIVTASVATASVVGANSIFALTAIDQGDAAVVEEPDEPSPAQQVAEAISQTVVTTGWKIQIAATPTHESALEILGKAQSKVPGALANAAPYTETVVKEDVTLYRARFAGFDNKAAARAACAQLTKHKFACLALSN